MTIQFKTAYGPRKRVIFTTEGKSLTKQSHRDECDVNVILRRFQVTGAAEHLNKYQGEYATFGAFDFHQAMNVVVEAEEMFMSLPSSVRKRFDNDPGAFLDFATKPENLGELQEMGLAPPPSLPPQEPAEPPPAAPPAEPGPEGA